MVDFCTSYLLFSSLYFHTISSILFFHKIHKPMLLVLVLVLLLISITAGFKIRTTTVREFDLVRGFKRAISLLLFLLLLAFLLDSEHTIEFLMWVLSPS